jgi:hypothetical protein
LIIITVYCDVCHASATLPNDVPLEGHAVEAELTQRGWSVIIGGRTEHLCPEPHLVLRKGVGDFGVSEN